MASEDAGEFIRVIASQLSEASLRDLSDLQLKEALSESLSALPGGSLKEELTGDFEKYFQELKSSQTTHSTRVGARRARKRKSAAREQVPEGEEEVEEEVSKRGEKEEEEWRAPRWSVNVLTSRGLEGSLAAVGEREEGSDGGKQQAYRMLLVAVQSDENAVSRVFQQWNEELTKSSPSECLEAVRFCSQVANNPRCFLPWLKFSFHLYSRLAERTSGGGPEASADELGKLRESIFGTLMQAHLMHSHLSTEQGSYEDMAAAILSLYIDTLSLAASRDNAPAHCTSEHLMCVVHTLLGHSSEHCLDAVLQTSTDPSSGSPHMLLPLFRKVLSQQAGAGAGAVQAGAGAVLTPTHYVKCVCGFHHAVALASAVDKPLTALQKLIHQVPVPIRFREWLWKRNPSACKKLGLKYSWSQERVVKHLLKKLAQDQVEELLDLAGDITMETQTAVMGSEEEPSKQDESSQQDLFFLDDEGESSKDTDYSEAEASAVSNQLENLIAQLPLESDEDKTYQSSAEEEGSIGRPSVPEDQDPSDTQTTFSVSTPGQKPEVDSDDEQPGEQEDPLLGQEVKSPCDINAGCDNVSDPAGVNKGNALEERSHGLMGPSAVAEDGNECHSFDSNTDLDTGSMDYSTYPETSVATATCTTGKLQKTRSMKTPPRNSHSSLATSYEYAPMLLRSSTKKKVSTTAAKTPKL